MRRHNFMPAPILPLPRRYAHLGLCFAVGGVALFAAVGAYVFGSVEVALTLQQPTTGTTMVVELQAGAADGQRLAGVVLAATADGSAMGTASGRRPGRSDTVGVVELANRTPYAQTLVATTRLLAPDGTLLRLKDRVTVPAQGTTTAAVYPDRAESFSRLAPARFTIPGLPAPLQEQIDAGSRVPLVAGGGEVAVVEAKDITATEQALTEQLTQTALLQANASLTAAQALYTKLVETEVVARSVDAQPGDERPSFSVSLTVRAVSIAFDEAKMLSVVRRNMSATLPPGQALAGLSVNDLTYAVQAYDVAAQTASVSVTANGVVGLAADSPWLNPAALAGLRREEVERYFAALGPTATATVRFRPTWLPAAPRVVNRIRIVVR